MTKLLVFAIGGIAVLPALAAEPALVKGIVCEGTKDRFGVVSTLIIKDISQRNATLILNLDGSIPDIRNSSLDSVTVNGKTIVGYVSHKSSIEPNAILFSAYTDGSTPQNTSKVTITFENDAKPVEMKCHDGMLDKN